MALITLNIDWSISSRLHRSNSTVASVCLKLHVKHVAYLTPGPVATRALHILFGGHTPCTIVYRPQEEKASIWLRPQFLGRMGRITQSMIPHRLSYIGKAVAHTVHLETEIERTGVPLEWLASYPFCYVLHIRSSGSVRGSKVALMVRAYLLWFEVPSDGMHNASVVEDDQIICSPVAEGLASFSCKSSLCYQSCGYTSCAPIEISVVAEARTKR